MALIKQVDNLGENINYLQNELRHFLHFYSELFQLQTSGLLVLNVV